MDPVSLVSTLTGVVAVGARSLYTFHCYLDDLKSAPADIRRLTTELSSLCNLLNRLESLLRTDFNGISPFPDDLTTDLRNDLNNCMSVFVELQVLGNRLAAGKGIRRRIVYTFEEKNVQKLRTGVEGYKAVINIALLFAISLSNANIATKAGDIHKDTTAIKGQLRVLIEKLSPDDLESLSMASDRSSVILRRYLDGTASYAPSIASTNDSVTLVQDEVPERRKRKSRGRRSRSRDEKRYSDDSHHSRRSKRRPKSDPIVFEKEIAYTSLGPEAGKSPGVTALTANADPVRGYGFLDRLFGHSKQRNISEPYDPMHLIHVDYDHEKGGYIGLPKEWARFLTEKHPMQMKR